MSEIIGDFPLVHPAMYGKPTRYTYIAVTDTIGNTAGQFKVGEGHLCCLLRWLCVVILTHVCDLHSSTSSCLLVRQPGMRHQRSCHDDTRAHIVRMHMHTHLTQHGGVGPVLTVYYVCVFVFDRVLCVVFNCSLLLPRALPSWICQPPGPRRSVL